MKFLLFFLILSPLQVSAFQVETFITVQGTSSVKNEAASGRLIVKISSADYNSSLVKLASAGYSIGPRLVPDADWYTVSFSTAMGVASSAAGVKGMGLEAYPDRIYRILRTPNDIYLPSQYYLSKIGVFGAWEYEVGSSAPVTIAIIDSGIDSSHPDLAAKVPGTGNKKIRYDGTSILDDNPPTVTCSHATEVSGVAGASTDNFIGIAGLSWRANLLSLNVFYQAACSSDCGGTDCKTYDSAIIKAVNYAKTLQDNPSYGKMILNMSLGGSGDCSVPLQSEITDAYSKGVILVAAAGNDSSSVNSPGNCYGVMPVSATDEDDNLAYFSSRGSGMLAGVSAPGVNIYTTEPGSLYGLADGTSFSAPVVSGLAALLWSYKPAKSNAEIADMIKKSADDLGSLGADSSYGYGRVNALRALLLASDKLKNFIGEKKVAAFPNPFRPAADKTINFYAPADISGGDMTIRIYNFNGDFITEIKNLSWDGKNSSGVPAASGPYIVHMKSANGSASGKFVLIR